MTQFDAGPGEWSDREWESPDRKPKPHARRRRVTLPPWALLAILVALVILLCVGLVLIVRALRNGRDTGTPTPLPTLTAEIAPIMPTETLPAIAPTDAVTPTSTVELPIAVPEASSTLTEIAPGATVLIQGTQGLGLNLRGEPTRQGRLVVNVKDGTALTVVDGPREADGHVWWKLRMSDGKEGWGAEDWLVLKTE
jgi:hypothetical protein